MLPHLKIYDSIILTLKDKQYYVYCVFNAFTHQQLHILEVVVFSSPVRKRERVSLGGDQWRGPRRGEDNARATPRPREVDGLRAIANVRLASAVVSLKRFLC